MLLGLMREEVVGGEDIGLLVHLSGEVVTTRIITCLGATAVSKVLILREYGLLLELVASLLSTNHDSALRWWWRHRDFE